jgi:hypothetical protein
MFRKKIKMDYNELLMLAERKLSSDYSHVLDEIKLRIASGSTGGEIGSLVGQYLDDLRRQNHAAYQSLKTEIDTYLSQFIVRRF